ncbi:MAG: PD40 domain-containing protein [Chloroflexi bacterium]|nr:PD40 domain-containing protein [Chloroflexota bacterium]
MGRGIARFMAGPVAASAVVLSFACGSSGRADIAFVSSRDGNPEVYVLEGQSGIPRRLTSTPDDRERDPVISPDGKKVAFLSSHGQGETGLWVMDIDGKNTRRIGGPPGDRVSFAWSPDALRLAYEIRGNGGTDIFVSEIESQKTIRVTRDAGAEDLGGWSRDGQWVVYALTEGALQGVNRKNPDGVNEIRITEREDHRPRWSPDGTRIAFMAKRDASDFDIYVVDINGSKEQNVTNAAGNDGDFDWSPDSRRIVFVSDRHGNPEVYAQVIGRKEATRLTNNNAIDAGPRWSRDGGEILFVSDADGDFDLYIMHPDGSRQERLTLNDVDDTGASW